MLSLFYFLSDLHADRAGVLAVRGGRRLSPAHLRRRISAGIPAKVLIRLGSRVVVSVGALVTACGLLLLHHAPVDGSSLRAILPGLMLMALAIGPVFGGVTSAANAGVGADDAGTISPPLNSARRARPRDPAGALLALRTANTREATMHADPPGGGV